MNVTHVYIGYQIMDLATMVKANFARNIQSLPTHVIAGQKRNTRLVCFLIQEEVKKR